MSHPARCGRARACNTDCRVNEIDWYYDISAEGVARFIARYAELRAEAAVKRAARDAERARMDACRARSRELVRAVKAKGRGAKGTPERLAQNKRVRAAIVAEFGEGMDRLIDWTVQ